MFVLIFFLFHTTVNDYLSNQNYTKNKKESKIPSYFSYGLRKQVNKLFVNFYFSFFALTIASAISLTLCAGDGAFKIPEVAPVPSAPNFTTL